jgi:hypothetical protein
MNDDPTVFLNNINNGDTFPVYIRTPVIPRVGDEVYYWVDYPTHLAREQRGLSNVEPGEPRSITGKVERVMIEYRQMEYASNNIPHIVTHAGVFLSDYKVTLYPEEKKNL